MPRFPFVVESHPWHALAPEDVLALLQTERTGLSYVTARQRYRQYGPNRTPPPRTFQQALLQPWRNPFTYLLLAIAAAMQVASGEGWMLLGVGGVHALLGIGLTLWSFRAVRVGSLGRGQHRQSQIPAAALVRRGGEDLDVPARALVLGDVVVLRPGDRPSVDLRLLEAEDLQVNESDLGGAAIALKQAATTLTADTPPLQRTNIVYAGTETIAGHGVGVAIATGGSTYLRAVYPTQQLESLAHRQLTRLQRVGAGTAIAGVLVATAFALGRGRPWQDTLAVAGTLAVAAYPQQLLRLATLAQLLGRQALARRRLWVKSPAAIDVLGRLDTIAIVVEADTALETLNTNAVFGVEWRGLIRASTGDAAALGDRLGIVLDSYFEAPVERMGLWQVQGLTIATIGREDEDLPLLRQADLGVCDRVAPRLLRDTAGLILPKEDYRYLPIAIAEGRAVRERLQHAVLLVLAASIELVMLAVAALACDVSLVPFQLLWVGSIVTPAFAIAFPLEPQPADVLQRSPRAFRAILGRDRWFALFLATSVVTGVTAITFWLKYQGMAANLAQARTMAFATLTLAQGFHACSLARGSLLNHPLLVALLGGAIALLVLVIQFPPLGEWTGTVPLDYTEWAAIALAASAVFWAQELTKH